ncbi:MAG: ferritin [Candidatus Methanomethylicaceae archaeon]|nr:ferritin [Candidatus Verstraetearchaeota archaeon]
MKLLSHRIEEYLNKQLNQELKNAYLYLSMAAFFDNLNLKGFSNYFKVQAKEELEHAMKIYEFIYNTEGKVILYDIAKPRDNWNTIIEVIEDFYNAEIENTKRIYELVDIAKEENNKVVESFLKWFIDEQVEEISNASDLLAKIKFIGEQKNALIMLDSKLSERK